ncbi:MAG: hypothetical protein Q8O56_13635 [Solirubrobacteraceae bacterium]|nr:hypothetical protein [Solirubrobacteraceae bacterium]
MAANQSKPKTGPGLRARVARRANGPSNAELARRVSALEEAVTESRRLNQRLSEVLDVVAEVLVPAADRDEEKLRALLARIEKTY